MPYQIYETNPPISTGNSFYYVNEYTISAAIECLCDGDSRALIIIFYRDKSCRIASQHPRSSGQSDTRPSCSLIGYSRSTEFLASIHAASSMDIALCKVAGWDLRKIDSIYLEIPQILSSMVPA